MRAVRCAAGASLHATHLAAAFAQLDRLRHLAGQARALANNAPTLLAPAGLQQRLRCLAELAEGATGALDRELTHLTDAAIARHDQLLTHWLAPPPPPSGHPDGHQPEG